MCAKQSCPDLLMFSQRPTISIPTYLSWLVKHLRPPSGLILAILYFLDRMSVIDETFTFNPRTAHRFLLVTMVAACKGQSDQVLTNRDFARIGGVRTFEISHLEREFLCKIE